MPPKVVFYDIESSNLNANFAVLLCVGYKVLGEDKIHCPALIDWKDHHRKHPTDDKKLVKHIRDVFQDADLLIGYYSKRFDRPFLEAKFLHHGFDPLPRTPEIDLYDAARMNLKIHSRRLGVVCQWLLGDTNKTTLSFDAWIKATAGHRPSFKYIIDHCKKDIIDLERCYLKLRPLIKTHPMLGRNLGECRYCGSWKLIKRGTIVKRTGVDIRVSCKECGGYDQRSPAQVKKWIA